MMKTKHKIILCIVSCSVLFLSLVLPCFALSSYKGDDVRYRLNAPHRVVTKVGSPDMPSNNTYTVIDIPTTVSTSQEYETLYQFGGLGYFSSFVGGATLISSYRTFDGRHPFADSYSQIVINQSSIPDGAYNSNESWYSFGYGYDHQTLQRVFSPQEFEQVRYLWQARAIDFEWDVYYYDPLTSMTERSKNGISLSCSIVVSKDFTPTDTTNDTISRYHRMFLSLRIVTDENEISSIATEIYPSVIGSNLVELQDSTYNLYVVNLSYRFVEAMDTKIRDFYGTRLPFSTVTSFGRLTASVSTPPANVLGVGGMGISPMYSLGISTFCGEDPYSDYARSLTRIDSSDSDTVGLFGWLGGAVGGFLDVPLFGFFSLGDLLAVCLAIGVTVLVLKLFAGG